jgi:hypothetical protein
VYADAGSLRFRSHHVSLRDKINANPKLGVGIGIGILVIAIAFMVLYFHSSHQPAQPGYDTTKGYFSDDDGKTTFVDSLSKIPPFDHNGKKAYRARVFVDSHGKRFVGWLEQYDDAAKKRLEKVISDTGDLPDRVLSESSDRPSVKRPGTTAWVSPKNMAAWQKITVPDPPDHNLDGLSVPIPTKEELQQAGT